MVLIKKKTIDNLTENNNYTVVLLVIVTIIYVDYQRDEDVT